MFVFYFLNVNKLLNYNDMKDFITKEKFEQYMNVQNEGKYNMLTESVEASKAANLTLEEYKEIIRDYSRYYDKFIGFNF